MRRAARSGSPGFSASSPPKPRHYTRDPRRVDAPACARVGDALARGRRAAANGPRTTDGSTGAMSAWTETYRGVVKAWECDTFAHFTIAFYFDRLADCSAAMLAGLGATAWQTDQLVVQYLKELRGGDGLHAESAVLTSAPGQIVLAHRILNSVTGEVCSLVEQRLVAGAGAPPIAPRPPLADWKAAAPTDTTEPAAFVPTGRDLVK